MEGKAERIAAFLKRQSERTRRVRGRLSAFLSGVRAITQFLKDVIRVAIWVYSSARDRKIVDGKCIIRKALSDPIMDRLQKLRETNVPMSDEPDVIVYRTSEGHYVTPSMIYKSTLECPYCTDETKGACKSCGGTRKIPLSSLLGTQFVEACEISNERMEEVITHLEVMQQEVELEEGEKLLLKVLKERRGEWWTQ